MKKVLGILLLIASFLPSVYADKINITVDTGAKGKPISGDLFGLFFEDINYAADGGLYAEMVQNRSFEYSPLDFPAWHAFTCWELVFRNGAKGAYFLGDVNPLHPNNPQYLELNCDAAAQNAGIGISNSGFDGMSFKTGASYEFSVFARQQPGVHISLEIRLESKNKELLGNVQITQLTSEWKKYRVTIQANRTDEDARLVVLAHGKGTVYLDMISLLPQKTFHNRPNGLRADLAQALADLKPKFIRFPGGCLTHGDGLKNLYLWKNTIGPVEQRKEQKNIWRYHQTMGLGYFEYFQFCEDIGAKPLPVVAAGVSCQNSDRYWGVGQQAIPIADMPAYIQDTLDLIEWANGPADSTWGAKRAEAGHPEPFNLQYLGVGNEDAQTPEFRERFKMIYEAVKAKYPHITIIGTVGPSPAGKDFDEGWKFANTLGLEMVDEHYYERPEWFLANLNRYDRYDRSRSKVYLGEYASRGNTLANALAEAAYMIGLERNGDVVHMASYAPLLAKIGHTQWSPDLIYFTNTKVMPSVNYYVQQMFCTNSGDMYLPAAIENSDPASGIAVCCVRDNTTTDLILKIVNTGVTSRIVQIKLSGLQGPSIKTVRTVLAGDPKTVNDGNNPKPITPQTSTHSTGAVFDYDTPAHSLTVIRIKNTVN